MGFLEYNLRIVVFHIVTIVGAAWILMDGIRTAKAQSIKTVLIVLAAAILLAFVFSMFASLSYRDHVKISGEIVDISHTGSWAGIFDSFSVRIRQSDGTLMWYHTSLFSSRSFKESVGYLEVGDYIEIFTGNFLNLFYRYEEISH